MNNNVHQRPQPYWSLGGDPVRVGDRVSFLGWEGTVKRFADRKRGPTIVVAWELEPGDQGPSTKLFWPDTLTRIGGGASNTATEITPAEAGEAQARYEAQACRDARLKDGGA